MDKKTAAIDHPRWGIGGRKDSYVTHTRAKSLGPRFRKRKDHILYSDVVKGLNLENIENCEKRETLWWWYVSAPEDFIGQLTSNPVDLKQKTGLEELHKHRVIGVGSGDRRGLEKETSCQWCASAPGDFIGRSTSSPREEKGVGRPHKHGVIGDRKGDRGRSAIPPWRDPKWLPCKNKH